MSSNLPYKQAANVERRTWDKEAYEARARARTEAAQQQASGAGGPPSQHPPAAAPAAASGEKRPLSALGGDAEPEKEEFVPAARGRAGPERSQRAYLKARTGRVDLEGKLGTTEIVSPDAVAVTGGGAGAAVAKGDGVSITDGVSKSSTGVGWHCKVCDCYLKDSMTYLDHINGRKHQRYLGYSMRVEKSTKDQVTNTLAKLAEEKRRAAAEASTAATAAASGNPAEEDKGCDGNEFEDAVRKKDEEALRRKADRARKREERKKREKDEQEEELEGGLDPDMAAMMGFSGFGGGNKNR